MHKSPNIITDTRNQQDGEVATDDQGRVVVRFNRYYRHSVDRVWRAITLPKEVVRWWHKFEIDPRVGGEIVTRQGNVGIITAFNPPNLLEYENEHGPVAGGLNVMRWRLQGDNQGCELTFSHTSPQGKLLPNGNISGWHAMLEQMEDWLEGQPVDWKAFTNDRVKELYSHYLSKRGEVGRVLPRFHGLFSKAHLISISSL